MTKYIHYCWFGGKSLPKLAKKCIKSWRKFLPDYEIIEWNENNVDLNECPFIKEAYENKKWAFVADYVRTKALYEKGGIYLDTDMKIVKDVTKLLQDEAFLGVEDSGYVAVGVWHEKNPGGFLAEQMLEFYRGLSGFDVDNMFDISIPKIATKYLEECGFELGNDKVQHLDRGIVVYPREYFYPLSYDRENNVFTDNTCMIHYYDASWTSKSEQRTNRIIRILGRKNGLRFIRICSRLKGYARRAIKLVLFPIVLYRRKKRWNTYIAETKQQINDDLRRIKKDSVVAIYRIDWLGTANATKELFENAVGVRGVTGELVGYFADKLLKKAPKMIVFSAFDETWFDVVLAIKQKNPKLKIKVIWHGGNALNIEEPDFTILKTLLEFNKKGLINSIAFVKKSMFDFYKTKGYNCEFLMNTVNIENKEKYLPRNVAKDEKVRIGVYASGDRWVKNFYNQLSAASMIENHVIDCIPKSPKTVEFAKMIDANVVGESKPVNREDLLGRLARNDVNVYVTFTECAPVIPLESMELGVPCITSNNHHYWEGTELEKYLVVDAADNIIEIQKQIEVALKNKKKIMKLYDEWKKEYEKECAKNFKAFMKK